jgi:DNA-binding Lrp family transcriptional regulator
MPVLQSKLFCVLNARTAETMTDKIAPLFTWRSSVASEHGPHPTLRHILLTLSLHMNERGGSCFPSQKTLATETGLSERAVRDRLKEAEKQGWLIRQHRDVSGQGWRRYEYRTQTPPSVVEALRGGEAYSAPSQEGGEGGSGIQEERPEGGSSPIEERAEYDSTKVGKEVPLSTSVNSPIDQQQQEAREREEVLDDLKAMANQYAKRIPAGMQRKRFKAEIRGIVTGDNAQAWTNDSGDRAPWKDRPAWLSLALDAYLEGVATSPHWAVKYVVNQQMSPLRMTPDTPKGATSKPSDPVTPSRVQSDALRKQEERAAQEEVKRAAEDERIAAWERQNAVEAERLQQEARKETEENPYNPPTWVEQIAREAYRARVLDRIGRKEAA